MKTRLLILASKIIYAGCRLLGKNGSVYPGRILFRRDIHVLNKIKYPKYVIGVTGSAGKGSTTSTIYHILTKNGYKVTYNESGSNAVRGIYTTIMRHTSVITKKVKGDVLLLELDEKHIKLAFPKCPLTHLVITNITRDQPARNAHPEIVFDIIMNSISKDTTLIINADDSIVNKATLGNNKVITYGINKTEYSEKKTDILAVDAAYCPVCHTKLKYKFYHYGHLGDYSCPNKCFKRGNPNYQADNIKLEQKQITINNNKVKIDKDVFFAVYYTVAAYAVCKEIGLDENKIVQALNDKKEAKRMKDYSYQNRLITMIESKNENNLSYLQSLNYIKNQKGKKSIIIGFDNVSRRYNLNDLSWLYDVNFEKLNDNNIDKIFCIGRFRYDVATRLYYAGIDKNKIILIDDLKNLLKDVTKKSKGHIYTMVCFDMTEIILGLVKGDKHD